MRNGGLALKLAALIAALAALILAVAVAVYLLRPAPTAVVLLQPPPPITPPVVPLEPAAPRLPRPPPPREVPAEPLEPSEETPARPAPVIRPAIVSGLLRRSDVLLSPRSYRDDWLAAFQSFSANRIVWTYAGPHYVKETATRKIPVQCTIPFWVPKDDPQEDRMACVNARGEPIRSTPDLVYPDINSAAWQHYVVGAVEELVDAGCTSFQQDVAWLNYQSALVRNGCYSPEGIAKFRGDRSEGSPSGAEPEELAAPAGTSDAEFDEFQRESTASYSAWLHDSIETYAREGDPSANVTFSGNFSPSWLVDGKSDWLLPDFDFVLGEATGTRESMPNSLRAMAHGTSRMPGVSGVTIPSSDVWLNQRAIASAYALGLTAIAPWDVYVPKEPRFFGDPADFSSLFAMVRANPSLFDDYVSDEDFYGDYGPVLPGQGTVTAVDRTSHPDRTTLSWSRREAPFQEVNVGRDVVVGGAGYQTIGPSNVGSIYLPGGATVAVGDPLYYVDGADSYLIAIRSNVRDPDRRAVHVVSWTERAPVSLFLHLRRSDFPDPPTLLVTPSKPIPTPVEPTVAGDYYVYPVGASIWAILY